MNCSDFQHRLTLAIERRDAEEFARLAGHGETCSDEECRQRWEECRFLARGIEAWRQHLPPMPRLSERVLRELSRTREASQVPAARPHARSRSGVAMLTAAAVLLLTTTLLIRSSDDELRLARLERARRVLAADGETVPPGAAYVGMAEEATSFVTDLAMLVVPVDVDLPAGDEPPPSSWFDRLGERLEPVRSGVETKFGEWFGSPAT
jgi:hypothetical protein